MSLELIYKGIAIETDLGHGIAKGIIDELLKRRFFIKAVKEIREPASHNPSFFHIGYNGYKVSILIGKDIENRWCCSIFSIKSFSEKQPPLFVV
jgi:hypothetical protein